MSVDFTRHGAVVQLALSRPERRNAMSVEMVAVLLGHLTRLRDAVDVGAIVLSGAGAGFCAGSDLKMLAAMNGAARAAFEADCGRLALELGDHPKPIVAAVKGFAMGGGFTLAAACDVVVSHPEARWSLPEVPVGLFPAWGLSQVEDRVGRPAARRLTWGIDVLSGHDALALGLVDQLADADPLTDALTIAERLARLPRDQTAAVKAYYSRGREDGGADARANRFFLSACESKEGRATFAKYG